MGLGKGAVAQQSGLDSLKQAFRVFMQSYALPLYILSLFAFTMLAPVDLSFPAYKELILKIFLMHFVFMGLLEWTIPRRYAAEGVKKKSQSLIVGVFNVFALGSFTKGAGVAFMISFVAMLSGGIQYPLGIHELPLFVQVLFAFLLNDLLRYWVHRTQHTVPFLWKFHRFHHDVETLNLTNLYRSHPLDYFLRNIFPPIVVFGLGFSGEAIFFSGMISMIAMYSHCGADLRLGLLNRIFVTSEVHRWHHVKEFKGIGYNFAVCLAIWDQLFGTYHMEPETEAPTLELGIRD